MAEPVPWKRLWLRLDTDRIKGLPGEGFLQDLDDIFGLRLRNGLKLLSEILDIPCLILCGEPGMGKSTALTLCRPQIEHRARQSGGIYWRSFRDVLSPAHLLTDLKSSPEWAGWLNGSECILVIDGLDEGLALASNLIRVLTTELRGRPIERLRLILSCHDSEWPSAEGAALMELWPSDNRARFQLQRLRISDVEEAARHWGMSAAQTEAFMSAVREKALEAFGARPITLRMLAEEFKASQSLSGTRLEAFRRACLRLCREDPERNKFLKPAKRYQFTSEQLLVVAKRVAAPLLLGRYSAVSRAPAEVQHLGFECLLSLEADEREQAGLEAVLGCALFRDAGGQSWTFAHQSYAEFLAADYLAEYPLPQVLDLLCFREAEHRFVVPQLAEVAGWLGLQHLEFLDWLISHEPEILLRNDASCLTDAQRGRFVGRLLDRMEREEVFDEWGSERLCGGFRHSGLADQLRPYLNGRNRGCSVRRVAIQIADLVGLTGVLEEIFAMAKDPSENIHLRAMALHVVARLLPQDRLAELEPFAQRDAGPDPHDELRGEALRALVPRHWTVSQTVPVLVKHATAGFGGEFDMVCENHLPDSIQAEDLPRLLEALLLVGGPFERCHNPVRTIACRALALALENLEAPGVAEAFLGLVRRTLDQKQEALYLPDNEWSERVEKVPSTRRRLASLFVAAMGATVDEMHRLLFHGFIRLELEDCPWVLQQLALSSPVGRPLWARLARRFWPEVSDSPYREPFFHACESSPELAAEVQWPCDVSLESLVARNTRECFERHRHSAQKATNQPPKRTADQRFESALASAIDHWRGWWGLCSELHRPENGSDFSILHLNLEKEYRWGVATAPQREAITSCARAFLLNATPSELPRTTGAECPLEVSWALWLLRGSFQEDSALHDVVMSKWFDALFAQSFGGVSEELDLAEIGASLDMHRAAGCLRERLNRALSRTLGTANVLRGFERTWKPEFTPVLLEFLGSQSVTGPSVGTALQFLAHHDGQAAEEWLSQRLQPTSIANTEVIVASALALFPGRFWEDLKARIAADKPLAESCIQVIADFHASSAHKLLEKLTAEQLGDLFLMMEDAFPSVQPTHLPNQATSPHEQIDRLRRFLPQRLEALASAAACHQLLRLADAVPHWRTTLRWHLHDARLACLRNAWSGVPLNIIRGIEAKRESRWVRSSDDLLDLVVEAIRRFQDELNRTEYPQVRDLWNESATLCPKDEDALTQKLVRWLRDYLGPKNGVALGCQVEPSPIHRTDIEVSARPPTSAPTGGSFVVTIEVKRSNNPEVLTSLEKQLVAEYLLRLGRTHGIYLIGWYRGKGWTPSPNPLGVHTFPEAKVKIDELLASSRKRHPELALEAVCLNCEFPQPFRKRS